MHNPKQHSRLSIPLWQWSLALLLVCGFGLTANSQYPAAVDEQSGHADVVATLDVPLAYSQHLALAKRPNSTQKDEDSPQPWGLLLVELPHHVVAHLVYRLPGLPEFHPALHSLVEQPRNPRAPPLV